MKNAVQILEAFAKVKGIIEVTEQGIGKGKKKRELSPAEAKWIAEMNTLMIALRDEFIRESHLRVKDLCEIFALSNQRIYQIRNKHKKAA